jgi:hypothetical protein
MSTTQYIGSLRKLNAKLLAEIVELRRECEVKIKYGRETYKLEQCNKEKLNLLQN